MPRVGFETAILVFDRSKAIRGLCDKNVSNISYKTVRFSIEGMQNGAARDGECRLIREFKVAQIH